MKLIHYIYIALALMLLSACQADEIVRYVYTVGEADNAIKLRAGISDGEAEVATRAGSEGTYVPFSAQTQLRLRMDGTWTGHSPEAISQMTTAKTAASATDKIDGISNDKHKVEFTAGEYLYWDDYGTADPANATTGRVTGLTIYGIAVEGKNTLPGTSPADLTSSTLSWTALTWNVGTVTGTAPNTKISQTGGWGDYDLITSNNIRPTTNGGEGTYTFANATANPITNNLLKFTHAMTKVTVNLTACLGFPGSENDAVNGGKFQQAPAVTLLGFNYKGTVSVEAKTSTPTANTTTNIEMWRDKGVAWASGGQHTSQFTAIVFPGNTFADTKNIIQLEVDGNTLFVTAKKINDANTETRNTFEQGKNYIINILVNKTGIVVTATVKDWIDVEAEEVAPKINVTKTYGHEGTAFKNDFDFFRSTTNTSGYSKDAWVEYSESTAEEHTYTFHDQLYWPDHNTHYFFRGVYPRVQTASQEAGWIPSAKVTTSTVAVSNAAYEVGKYPSDLAFGWPKKDNDTEDDETCKVHSNKQGICATEDDIRMNFKYVMSKVQVSLKSSGEAGKDKVDLSNIVVEIINGKKSGEIRLSDGLHEVFADGDKGSYTLNRTTTPAAGFDVTTLDAIVPQALDNDVKIRITVKDGSEVLDVYEAQLNEVKIKTNDGTGAKIEEWEPGKFYQYELDIKKTAIKVTATLTDWVEVEAKDDVWF